MPRLEVQIEDQKQIVPFKGSCITIGREAGNDVVIADKGADASIEMHRRFGFREIGRMGRVGFKFERWLGTVLMQKSLK